ncbi:hypothetical protein K435DRAFT_61887 [Dendrothele bispora CBS 962.96]|uniref:Uncharacterized protein n=1 Tax=Dendrothele bispora (strain CBS 962.96) TaxID=1314807 RepID=A0A4S8MTW7_DENBC|nr:hypothetical protein K435DRAFT_61887 [Dendrothele bispora CBS 962.96]
MPQLSALYPLLIILATAAESNKAENMNEMTLSQSLRFASQRSSTDNPHVMESTNVELAVVSCGSNDIAFEPED